MDKTNSSQPSQHLAPAAPSTFGHACLQSMALVRTGVGLGCLIMPSLALRLCGIPVPISVPTVLMTRLAGARDAMLAFALVWALRNESQKVLSTETRRTTRSVILAGILVDVADSLSVFAIAASSGGLSPKAIGVFGGGAVLFSAIGAVGLAAYK